MTLITNGAADYLNYFLRFHYRQITNGEIRVILAPVSYTHLDVYKRQDLDSDIGRIAFHIATVFSSSSNNPKDFLDIVI